jgi:hypothetical protein
MVHNVVLTVLVGVLVEMLVHPRRQEEAMHWLVPNRTILMVQVIPVREMPVPVLLVAVAALKMIACTRALPNSNALLWDLYTRRASTPCS